MSRYTKQPKPSPETRDEAMHIARGTQRPGQTKEQTKLIAQGIQKGIDQYKKEYKAKVRELDRQRQKLSRKKPDHAEHDSQQADEKPRRQHWLPWLLLVITWAGIAIYFAFLRVLN
jgi:Flp pilus assembly protein TadB